MTQNNDKIDIDSTKKSKHNDPDDVIFDEVDEEGKSTASTKKVREKLHACEEEKKKYLDGWQRCKADAINGRKRDENSRITAVQTAKEDVILSILPVLDSFEIAFGDKKSLEAMDSDWVAGMKHIQSQLISVFGEYGIEQIDPEGERFDPNTQESVEIREVKDEKSDDKILDVIQKGYIINGKVLRPAKVVVGAFRK